MKVKYLGESDPLSFINGKVYEVLSIEYGYYRIVDETDEDFLYDVDFFKVVEESYDVENLTDPKISKYYTGPVTTDHYGQRIPKQAHGTVNLDRYT